MSLVEIIVLNKEDAIMAEANGADRLELVSAIGEGGLTPSYGIIKTVVNSVDIPVMVMVRPHSYSFTYLKNEWSAMKDDIKMIKELGAAGIVFGALTEHGTLDFEFLSMVLEECKGLSVTFHRAIDETNPLGLYQSLIGSSFHVDRILTSGGNPTAIEGISTLKEMIQQSKQSAHYPIIMPGSGLSLDNIEFVHKELRASEYHFGSAVRMGGSFQNQIEGNKIKQLKELLT
ncbi:copper homeostasis protein CutC [Bacillus sp. JJ1764]|uniref:copper homeostasis protein CutC n=1 Tax=Bacillus sp. JJ1764 TaxID=3122964 RepID=UPI002FFDE5DA